MLKLKYPEITGGKVIVAQSLETLDVEGDLTITSGALSLSTLASSQKLLVGGEPCAERRHGRCWAGGLYRREQPHAEQRHV